MHLCPLKTHKLKLLVGRWKTTEFEWISLHFLVERTWKMKQLLIWFLCKIWLLCYIIKSIQQHVQIWVVIGSPHIYYILFRLPVVLGSLNRSAHAYVVQFIWFYANWIQIFVNLSLKWQMYFIYSNADVFYIQ